MNTVRVTKLYSSSGIPSASTPFTLSAESLRKGCKSAHTQIQSALPQEWINQQKRYFYRQTNPHDDGFWSLMSFRLPSCEK